MMSRRLLGVPFAVLLAFAAAAPALAYNGENELHLRLSQPQHVGCGEAAPLIATVTDKQGDPQADVIVGFIKHQGSPGDMLAPASEVTDASGNADSTYTIPCGSESRARVIKACEPAGACATTVVVCRQSDGCTANGTAAGLVVPAASSRGLATAAVAFEPRTVPTPSTRPLLLNVMSFAIVALLAAGIIRGRPKTLRAATSG